MKTKKELQALKEENIFSYRSQFSDS